MHKATAQTINADLPDIALAHELKKGDAQAFTLLMRRHNRRLFRTARSIVQDDAEAEDVLQEAYLLAYRNIGQFRGESSLRTWLTRIVVNEAIARSRSARRRAAVIRLDGELESDHMEKTYEGNMRDAVSQPEQAAMRDEIRCVLERKIDALPDAFRTVFVLRALEEMNVEEVALCLSISAATVRTRFFRARSLLRESLSQEIDFAFEEAFAFGGTRCDRIVASVIARLERAPGD